MGRVQGELSMCVGIRFRLVVPLYTHIYVCTKYIVHEIWWPAFLSFSGILLPSFNLNKHLSKSLFYWLHSMPQNDFLIVCEQSPIMGHLWNFCISWLPPPVDKFGCSTLKDVWTTSEKTFKKCSDTFGYMRPLHCWHHYSNYPQLCRPCGRCPGFFWYNMFRPLRNINSGDVYVATAAREEIGLAPEMWIPGDRSPAMRQTGKATIKP